MNKEYKTKTKVRKKNKNNLALYHFDQELYGEEIKTIAGIDEVGRGALAGPVVACCVVLKKDFYHPLINDSKQIAKKYYPMLSTLIKENSVAFGIGIVESKMIDQINILNATKLAMKQAIEQVCSKVNVNLLLIDAINLDINIRQKKIIKGDQISFSIAAASIVAKNSRDQLMIRYKDVYPDYGFDQHVGYGTKKHLDSIEKYGYSSIHRKSFKIKKSKI